MSYRNYGLGSYLPVRVHSGNIEIQFNTGVEQYPTRLNIETDWQIRQFNMLECLFVIEHDGVRYVGREDGSVSGYRLSDDLLVCSSGWKVPPKPRMKQIGAVHTLVPCVASLDLVRERIVYAPYTKHEFVFDEPFREDVFMPTALAEALGNETLSLFIWDSNGEEVNCNEKGQWFIQKPFTGICDCHIF